MTSSEHIVLNGNGSTWPDRTGSLAATPSVSALLTRQMRTWAVTIATLGSGVLNVLSVIGPSPHERRVILRSLFPLEFLHISRFLTLLIGFALVVASINIRKRKKRAFKLVLALACASVLFHITKGLDYEEATFSVALAAVLVWTRKDFTVESSMLDLRGGAARLAVAAALALAYGVAGFWLLEPREFGVNFTLGAALRNTVQFLSLAGNPTVVPHTRYARWFLDSLYLMTATTMAYSAYALFRPVVYRLPTHPRDVQGLRWELVAAAVACDILSYVCQGWRWRLLLAPAGRLSTLRATQAIYAGLFTNEVLPLRMGEFVRAWLATRWLAVDFATVAVTVAVERLFDGMWLALAIGITAMLVPLPGRVLGAADALGAGVLLATAACAWVAFRKRRPGERTSRLQQLTGALADSLRSVSNGWVLCASFSVSSLILLGQVLAFWLVMVAGGLSLSFWAGAAVLLIVHLGTAVPNAPANLGTYQFSTVVGLSLFGVEKARATAFSVVVFVILTVPLWLIGSAALAHSGLSLGRIRKRAM